MMVVAIDSGLYNHHLSRSAEPDYSEMVGEVVAHPTQAARLGLRNRSDHAWQKFEADGTERSVAPGQVLSLTPGVKVRIGEVEFSLD